MQKAAQYTMRFILLLVQWVGLTLFILFVWHFTLVGVLDYQHNKNIYLTQLLFQEKNEITGLLQRQQSINALESRLSFITHLRQQNNQSAYLLDAIRNAIPPTILFSQLKRNGQTMILDGRAESDSDIVHLMENIARSPLFQQPVITAIGVKQKKRYFQLKIGIR